MSPPLFLAAGILSHSATWLCWTIFPRFVKAKLLLRQKERNPLFFFFNSSGIYDEESSGWNRKWAMLQSKVELGSHRDGADVLLLFDATWDDKGQYGIG